MKNNLVESIGDVVTIRDAFSFASFFLQKIGIEEYILEARHLLCFLLKKDKVSFFRDLNELFPEEAKESFLVFLKRREAREPLQYILGCWDFYGRQYLLNKNVLIPRQETEILVAIALKIAKQLLKNKKKITIADIGTGSGIIAITLALEIKCCNIFAIDIAEKALDVARENAKKYSVLDKVTFLKGNLLTPLYGKKIDIIVSNPPYIKSIEVSLLQKELAYEPKIALDAGLDGLKYYKEIAKQLKFLAGSYLCFEVGVNQAKAVEKILKESYPSSRVSFFNDMAGKQRFVVCNFN